MQADECFPTLKSNNANLADYQEHHKPICYPTVLILIKQHIILKKYINAIAAIRINYSTFK